MIKAAIHSLSPKGVGEKIGYVTFIDTDEGLYIQPALTGLPSGERGFHIHEFGDIEPKDGVAGGKAGQHYDPDKTGKHLGPYRNGHRGDLPRLIVNADGTATQPVLAPRLTLDEIVGRAIIVHAGGDNYSDTPEKNGGGKRRIAGGIISNDCPYCRVENYKKLGMLAIAGYGLYKLSKRSKE